MKTKWEYYKENRYYVHNIVVIIIAGFFFGSWYKNGFTFATLIGCLLTVGSLVVTFFQVTTAYRKYVEQEIEKRDWTKEGVAIKFGEPTRTDMINQEEDD